MTLSAFNVDVLMTAAVIHPVSHYCVRYVVLKPNSITLSWSQTGPRLVADLLAASLRNGMWPLLLVGESDAVMETGPVDRRRLPVWSGGH